MVNEEKVKIMNRLAMYEHGEGRKYLPVSRYYRSDYIGLALIRNFFLVTIGYIFDTDLHPVFCEIFPGKKKCQGILSGSYKTGKNLRAGGKKKSGPEKCRRT